MEAFEPKELAYFALASGNVAALVDINGSIVRESQEQLRR